MAAPPSGVATRVVVGDGLAAGGLDLVDDLLRRRRVEPPVPSTEPPRSLTTIERAPRGQLERVGAAEAAAGAGDDRDLAVEADVRHVGIPRSR